MNGYESSTAPTGFTVRDAGVDNTRMCRYCSSLECAHCIEDPLDSTKEKCLYCLDSLVDPFPALVGLGAGCA